MNIPFKSKLIRFKNIENRNIAFYKLSKKEQRQEIAYDGLLLLTTSDKIDNSKSMLYWSPSLETIQKHSKTAGELQLKLINELPVCQVCARGIIMLSKIRISNNIEPEDVDADSGCAENMKSFSIENMEEMEEEYEYNQFNTPYILRTTEKLINILCNIINNGKFKKSDRKDYINLWKLDIIQKIKK